MLGPLPFAVATPVFQFPHLTTLAGRAPLGGARETALATLVASRLAAAVLPPDTLPATLRRARADAARQWLLALALPAPVRTALARLVDASADGDPGSVAATLAKVTDVTAPHLDRGARLELERLATRLRG